MRPDASRMPLPRSNMARGSKADLAARQARDSESSLGSRNVSGSASKASGRLTAALRSSRSFPGERPPMAPVPAPAPAPARQQTPAPVPAARSTPRSARSTARSTPRSARGATPRLARPGSARPSAREQRQRDAERARARPASARKSRREGQRHGILWGEGERDDGSARARGRAHTPARAPRLGHDASAVASGLLRKLYEKECEADLPRGRAAPTEEVAAAAAPQEAPWSPTREGARARQGRRAVTPAFPEGQVLDDLPRGRVAFQTHSHERWRDWSGDHLPESESRARRHYAQPRTVKGHRYERGMSSDSHARLRPPAESAAPQTPAVRATSRRHGRIPRRSIDLSWAEEPENVSPRSNYIVPVGLLCNQGPEKKHFANSTSVGSLIVQQHMTLAGSRGTASAGALRSLPRSTVMGSLIFSG